MISHKFLTGCKLRFEGNDTKLTCNSVMIMGKSKFANSVDGSTGIFLGERGAELESPEEHIDKLWSVTVNNRGALSNSTNC